MPIQLKPSIFREYDIRGIAGVDISADFANLLGRAYAKWIQDSLNLRPAKGRGRLKIGVGADCRLTSPDYSAALISGLLSGGVDVVRLGTCATPLTYFSVFHLGLEGAIMVTGSHNPSNYNGFKTCVGKETIHGSQIQDLRKIMEELNATTHKISSAPISGSLSEFAIIPAYIKEITQKLGQFRPLKVVLDAGNGTASNIAPELFKNIGALVTPLYCELDGRFPNHHPDPTVPENLKSLVATVLREGADFGVGFDGDSDRIGLVDEKGRIIYGDELMILLSRSVLKKNPGATIISEVKSSHRLYEDIAKNGGKPIMWKTGHSLIKAKMKETGALLAGEMSGHIFFADRYYGYDDAIYAAARVLEILAHSDQPLSSLLADLTKTVSTPEIRVDCEEEKKFALVETTKGRLLSKGKINDIDGVRIDFGDSWGLVRASNTQPVIVLRFEAPTESRLEEIRTLVETELKSAAKAIGHSPIDPRQGGGH